MPVESDDDAIVGLAFVTDRSEDAATGHPHPTPWLEINSPRLRAKVGNPSPAFDGRVTSEREKKTGSATTGDKAQRPDEGTAADRTRHKRWRAPKTKATSHDAAANQEQ